MLEFNERWIRVCWDDSIRAIFVEWKAYADGDEYRAGLDALYNLLCQKRADRYLVDCRRLGPISQDDQRWTNSDWFPRMIAGGLRYIAIVSPTAAVARLSVKQILSKVDKVNLLTAHFDDMAAAKSWIRHEGR